MCKLKTKSWRKKGKKRQIERWRQVDRNLQVSEGLIQLITCLPTYNTRIFQQCCLITDSLLNEIWCKQEAHAVKGEDFLSREDIKTEDMLGEGWYKMGA